MKIDQINIGGIKGQSKISWFLSVANLMTSYHVKDSLSLKLTTFNAIILAEQLILLFLISPSCLLTEKLSTT